MPKCERRAWTRPYDHKGEKLQGRVDRALAQGTEQAARNMRLPSVCTLSGIYRINDQYFTKAKLKFEYRPDVIDKPELLMIPVPGGSNFVQTGDLT